MRDPQAVCGLTENAVDTRPHPARDLSCSCLRKVESPLRLQHIFPERLSSKSVLRLGFWRVTLRGFAISLFSEARFLFAEKCDVVKTQEQTDSHTLLFCLSPFLFIFPFATHKSLALDSLVPVSVSRTFAFSRGDSLAGSPGKHAWVCRVSVESVGCARGHWSLSLSCEGTSVSHRHCQD